MAGIFSRAIHAWRVLYLSLAVLLIAAIPQQTNANPSRFSLPSLMLWAWERPEDLTYIDPARTGVAFLAETIILTKNDVLLRHRHQPLYVPPATSLIAVIHIGDVPGTSPALSRFQQQQIVKAITALAGHPGYRGIQLDFEAPPSERDFYRQLVQDLHAHLPVGEFFSVTALSSSCLGDNWLRHLPVREIVPMLFNMGAGTNTVIGHFARGEDFSSGDCRHSLGVSLQEAGMLQIVPRDRRIYVFNAHRWRRKDYLFLLQELTASALKEPALSLNGNFEEGAN